MLQELVPIVARWRDLLILLVVVCCALTTTTGAVASISSSEPMMRGYTRRLWQSEDGLPDQSIQAFAQTSDDSLWIGTKGGLLRFDGARFRVYDRAVAPSSLERGVNTLLTGADGTMWIGTEGGGLFSFRNERFQSYPIEGSEAKSPIFIRALYQDRGGQVWVGSDQGLFRVNRDRLLRVDGRDGIPTIFVRCIAGDANGNVWVGGTRFLELHGTKPLKEYPLVRTTSLNLITAMHITSDGKFWIGMLSGLYRFDPSSRTPFRHVTGISAQVSVVHESLGRRLWVGTVGRGLFLVDGEQSYRVPGSLLPSQTLGAIFSDDEGNLWVGTRAGLIRFSKTSVEIMPAPGGADSEFETVFRDRDGAVWVAAQSQLFQVRENHLIPYVLSRFPRVRVRTLFRDRRGELWVGTDGEGLLHLKKNGVDRYSSGHGLANDFVRAIVQSRDGSMWVGTDGGLTHITARASRNYSVNDGLAYFSVTSLFEDATGDLWVGTSRGLTHIAKGNVVTDIPTKALTQEQLWSINQDAAGVLWFAATSGLYGWNGRELVHLTTANGLATNENYAVLPDRNGNIWLSGPNSVSRIFARELDRFIAGQLSRIHLEQYLSPFDLDSAELYSGMQPNGVTSSDGSVWFPSNRGAVHVQSIDMPSPVPLHMVLDEIVANGRQLPVSGLATLGPDDDRLEISYTVIRLRSQESLRYRYELEGLDSWTQPTDRRTVTYSHLPPGKYRFRVQAFALDGPELISEASIQITKRPHFYKTRWFVAVCVVTALGLVLLMYRLRLRQMHLRFRAIAEERERIAREMHDTLIQGCVGVSTLLDAALGLEATDDELRQELLSYATHQAQSTVETAREAVWNLRHHYDVKATDAGSLCRELASEFQERSGIPIDCEVGGPHPVLIDSDAHELLMILREALSNAIAHAQPNRVSLRARVVNEQLEIDIVDDGRGFNREDQNIQNRHFGLVGMEERAKLLGGRVLIRSVLGCGTHICIKVPQGVRSLDKRCVSGSFDSG